MEKINHLTKKFLALVFLALIIACCSFIFFARRQSSGVSLKEKIVLGEGDVKIPNTLNCNFLDRRLFETVISKEGNDERQKVIRGAVIPHHILAGELIGDLFSKLKKQNPPIVFIIGPNHYESGNCQLLSSYSQWQTPGGLVKSEGGIINLLEKEKMIRTDDAILENEHSIAALLPYLKNYLPDARVVPLIASRRMNPESVKKVSDFISPYLEQGAVVIGSVDFSHYLNMEMAQINDNKTLEAIKEKNYNRLFSFTSNNLDSPASLSVVLMSMENIKVQNMEVLFHTNSEEIIGSNQASTTSYFEIIYF